MILHRCPTCGAFEKMDLFSERDKEIEGYKATMIAAAEEIMRCWEAHCDEEGYGPSNLLHRLEAGIPANYSYTAGDFEKLTQERDRLKIQVDEITKERDEIHQLVLGRYVLSNTGLRILFEPSAAKETWRTDFQTPPHVAKYMVGLIPSGCKTVLEPTPGIGRIASEILAAGYDLTAPDDFFLLTPRKFDCVVMNPPFSTKWAFLENAPEHMNETGMRFGYYLLTECMKMSDNVIALMPWFTISDSDLRLRNLKRFGLKSVTALPRNTFQYARIQTCVLELEKGFRGTTAMHVLSFNQNQIEIEL